MAENSNKNENTRLTKKAKIGFIIAAIAVAFSVFMVYSLNNPSEQEVPNVKGKTAKQAQKILLNKGFDDIRISDEDGNSITDETGFDLKKFKVVSQSPKAKTLKNTEDPIKLTAETIKKQSPKKLKRISSDDSENLTDSSSSGEFNEVTGAATGTEEAENGNTTSADSQNLNSMENQTQENTSVSPEEEAISKVKSYIKVQPFSEKGIFEKLTEVEGFDQETAEYAVENAGIDWNKQAYRKAKDYLEITDEYSKEDMIETLQNNDQFTKSQAKYGAEKAGL